MQTIQGYDSTKEYKRDDIVANEGDEFYMVIADSVTGKEPSANPTEFKLIPRGGAETYNVNDLAVFEGAVFKRIEPAEGEAPYEPGKGPRENPTAWMGIAIRGSLNSGKGKGNNSGKKGNNSGNSAAAGEIQDFDKVTIYNTGDLIRYEGKIYKLIVPFGSSGYNPSGYPDHFVEMIEGPNGLQEVTTTSVPAGEIQDYDNFKAYSAGDLIRYKSEVGDTAFEGKIYKMTVGIGAAGYAPPGHPDNFVEMIEGPNGLQEAPRTTTTAEPPAYDDTVVYKLGDVIKGPDGKIYKMIDGIGLPGYPPPRPSNWELVTAGGGRRRRRTQRSKRRKGSRRH
jgi:hypothetical protein